MPPPKSSDTYSLSLSSTPHPRFHLITWYQRPLNRPPAPPTIPARLIMEVTGSRSESVNETLSSVIALLETEQVLKKVRPVCPTIYPTVCLPSFPSFTVLHACSAISTLVSMTIKTRADQSVHKGSSGAYRRSRPCFPKRAQ